MKTVISVAIVTILLVSIGYHAHRELILTTHYSPLVPLLLKLFKWTVMSF